MIRDHAYHGDHQDERTRLKTRRREIERERRRLGSLVQAEHEYVNGYGQALSLQDPRDIANHIHGLTYGMQRFLSWDEGAGEATVEAIGAQCIAYLLARARVDELDVAAGDPS
jgi:hypothetical protein